MVSGISPDNEAFLNEVVAAGQFPNRDAAINDALQLLRQTKLKGTAPKLGRLGKTPDEWIADLIAWSNSHPPVTHFVDDSRESIYD